MNKNYLWGIAVAVLVLLVGGIYFFRGPAAPTSPAVENLNSVTATSPAVGNAGGGSAQNVETKNTIVYTDNGFSPQNLTVAKGTSVTFTNNASSAFWPASNPHPVHTGYDGTSRDQHCSNPTGAAFDACGPIPMGGQYVFTFNKTGTWGYHNHLNPGQGGTITVQ